MKKVFLEAHNIKNKFSGFGQFNYHLLKALALQKKEHFDIVVNAKNIQALKDEFGSEFKYHKYVPISRYRLFQIKKRYDLWHCMNQNISIEPFYNIPYLLTVHDIHFIEEGDVIKQQLERKRFQEKLNRSHAITYISNYTKTATHQHFEVPNVAEYVIYNGNTITDLTLANNFELQHDLKKPYLFSIGDFSERKNFKSLIEMLRFLPDYNLVLAGNNASDYAKELQKLVRQNKFSDRVLVTGKVNDIEKQFYLKNCEAFVFPSLREGFGIPPIEAMRFGKPVFLSNNSSLPEIGGEHAFYWDHYDPEYMAVVVTNGLSVYNRSKESFQNKYIEHAQRFNWETAAKDYIKVYESILNPTD